MTTPLRKLLNEFRDRTLTERDKGTSFENLIVQYLKTEPFYKEKYVDVLSYADWVDQYGETLNITNKKDTGIDLVAVTEDQSFHAIQCKNYAEDYKLSKKDIDSFFTASGKNYFSQRIIVSTTTQWTENAADSLENQNPPVSKIDLYALENSVIDWSQYHEKLKPTLKPLKQLRPHQKGALSDVIRRLATEDRGKLIMACGTGKTFTSLKIAEEMAGVGKRVLFLVPSLSLLSQSLTEWTQESSIPLRSYAVCSDSDVGKKHSKDDDEVITGMSDLQYPATTNAKQLALTLEARHKNDEMTVVFSTYHSIAVISEAQKNFQMKEFDLIICDEAHRTTGATFEGEDESTFVRIHNNDYVAGKKRLYMTATPRIYGENAKQTENVELCSMDDKSLFGEDLHVITFSQAVSLGLLVDYKVVVLAVEESQISRSLQNLLKDDDNSLKVDDAAKIVGCWKALSKQGFDDHDTNPMKRAVAFCQVINKEYKGKAHKVSSIQISEMFGAVVEEYQKYEQAQLLAEYPDKELPIALSMKCEAEHVDGGMNASEKESKLDWLKEATPDNTCRILSNVRCLSEGVDVPSLDAVLFLTPRSSQVDVVQSVGRVMRLAPNKKLGYVILPVVIPAGVEPDKAMDDNQTYRVVWQVLNALRSHDNRFDAMINKMEFNGNDRNRMEVIAMVDQVNRKATKQTAKEKSAGKAKGGSSIGTAEPQPIQDAFTFEVGAIERALCAKIVKKCGNRFHWEDWANDIAKIANTHIDRITGILENPENITERETFEEFARELRDDLNNSITDTEIIEMLAQHIITKPVFDALFDKYSFAKHNPMSKAMQAVLDRLQEHRLDKEAKTLHDFYESVKMRAEGIQSAEGKQRIIVELYDKFFRNAFPRMTERLGIVYTPVEVVDFIIHSVEDVLKQEFNTSLANDNVHILDPFTGTGTFITRLLQSGIIPNEKLPYKYKNEIHANEIVLLAYYIAAINIEATYHGILSNNITGQNDDAQKDIPYVPFEGICLTDTFQMNETADLVDVLLEENSSRRKRQQELPINVIIGNPPYSAGQESANDDNANIAYPKLDNRISETYISRSLGKGGKRSSYDSYIRAIRWSSDRIGDKGIIGFVTNASFIESNASDGLRKCLVEEFSSLYIFHLRGNARTSGERRRKEKDNVFGQGTRTPIAISLLVKNPEAKEHGNIYFHDIGDYLSQSDKLGIIQEFKSLTGITQKSDWNTIIPDQFGDWVNQRDPNFDNYFSLGTKAKDNTPVIFNKFSNGVVSSRDAWVYNFSKLKLTNNNKKMIGFYNSEIDRFENTIQESERASVDIKSFVKKDENQISWGGASWQPKFKKLLREKFLESEIQINSYRPFTKAYHLRNTSFNHSFYSLNYLFPNDTLSNLSFSMTGIGSNKEFSILITNLLPDYEMISKGLHFPLYLYEKKDLTKGNDDLFDQDNDVTQEEEYTRKDAITDEALKHFQDAYPNNAITKEDLFYYIYGLLHSEEYREKYADNLTKQLPRIPRVKTYKDFIHFSTAGRELAELHLNYETVDIYEKAKLKGKNSYTTTKQAIKGGEDSDYYVTKMKFAKKKDPETNKSVNDLSTVIYNNFITIENIPEEAYDYVVNGKPALEWVMERQSVTTHKDSGITNDANDWAIETMKNARYPLELFLRVITVSLETQKIVNGLPKLDLLKD